ncbi:hypothetical protein [Hymenobacter cavernae]|uniref:Uncharacterized protein n=1 Tax=Hymenobacter cavernae TaxID=2044852 RepID=A0ABQ1UNA2_9BACT|nr:hypothetical protein [Hymenobacter cavernae]GGF22178.1 hypothetical protein GCM10011383_37250 [Hymenobacter cavernae]
MLRVYYTSAKVVPPVGPFHRPETKAHAARVDAAGGVLYDLDLIDLCFAWAENQGISTAPNAFMHWSAVVFGVVKDANDYVSRIFCLFGNDLVRTSGFPFYDVNAYGQGRSSVFLPANCSFSATWSTNSPRYTTSFGLGTIGNNPNSPVTLYSENGIGHFLFFYDSGNPVMCILDGPQGRTMQTDGAGGYYGSRRTAVRIDLASNDPINYQYNGLRRQGSQWYNYQNVGGQYAATLNLGITAGQSGAYRYGMQLASSGYWTDAQISSFDALLQQIYPDAPYINV